LHQRAGERARRFGYYSWREAFVFSFAAPDDDTL
jgi:hypothetical protein